MLAVSFSMAIYHCLLGWEVAKWDISTQLLVLLIDVSVGCSTVHWPVSWQLARFVTWPTAEDAEIRMSTERCLNDKLAVGIPWLVDARLSNLRACKVCHIHQLVPTTAIWELAIEHNIHKKESTIATLWKLLFFFDCFYSCEQPLVAFKPIFVGSHKTSVIFYG